MGEERKTNSPFGKKVYEILKTTPKGKVVTYGQLAKMAEKPKAARAVGTMMRKNKDPKHIPCYKVVRGDLRIGKYSAKGGIKRKDHLLKKDGIETKNGKIEQKYLYDEKK